MTSRLNKVFYDHPCEVMAKKLLGKVLCRKLDTGEVLKGRIVETEMYPGSTDKASHSFNNKKTKRNGAMFMEPGTAYVYYIYGMYFCFNISTQETGGCVLIRSLEPTLGVEEMRSRRLKSKKKGSKASLLKDTDLCSGPSKLCQALGITIDDNKVDLTEISSTLWLEDGPDLPEDRVFVSKRIGINSYGSASADKPFRFYEKGNNHVSVIDKDDDASPRKKTKKVSSLSS